MPLNSTVRLVHRRGSAVTHATASTLRTERQGQGYRRLGAQAPFGSLFRKLANRRARVFNRVEFHSPQRSRRPPAGAAPLCITRQLLYCTGYARFLTVSGAQGDGSCLFHSLSYGLGRGSAGQLRRETADWCVGYRVGHPFCAPVCRGWHLRCLRLWVVSMSPPGDCRCQD